MIQIRMKAKEGKEFFYIGVYRARGGEIVIKIGTTNNMKRREGQHKTACPSLKNFPASPIENFRYLWSRELSQRNTHHLENSAREELKKHEQFQFQANDRFVLRKECPETIEVKIRKSHFIPLRQLLEGQGF